ncbi:MAG TPA: VWA domain-containing protein [Saprospiraceae bacterium]|nr:VWA domain-containing protein [Saprospiraceae bacterium]HNL40232.1 VWA domain-containing protein [Saprospiraceae bacterium]HNM23877.1 VWA domain-containing protein [Saprospiraceae bacterium]
MDTLERWRLVLGSAADPEQDIALSAELTQMDRVLEALYDAERRGGLGRSAPNVNRWLGDIRRYFPTPVVQVMQRDAFERLGLHQLLLEPELLASVEPDVHLVATLLSLNKVLPAQTRETARAVVRKVVEELEKKLRAPLREAIQSALNRSVRNRRPRPNEIDWRRTIYHNLKNYQPSLQTIIPDTLHGYGRKGQALRHVILLADQSGSMASSVVYAGIMGAVLASIRSLRTHVVAFDTAVADLSDQLHDPVELLFGTQLGGGTDIHKALLYAETLVERPHDTILVLLSDLFEGGNRAEMLKKVQQLRRSGVTVIALLALNDEGAPAYDHDNAAAFSAMDIPTFACTPTLFPELLAAAIQRRDLRNWAGQHDLSIKSSV